MAISKKDLFKVFLKPRDAYLLFLAKEETDTTLLPEPLTSEDKEMYDLCTAFASTVSDRATDIAAAEDWATKTDGAVANGEYSAKYYALLAKDWATKTSAAVADGEYSAKKYAQDAAASAAAAAESASAEPAAGDSAGT